MKHARSRPDWDKVATVVRTLGVVLLAIGLVHFYADRVLFDARVFSTHAASSLADPRVATHVAGAVADQAITERRDLTGYRPLLVGAARTVVSSEPFRALFQRAAERGHRLLFSEGVEILTLSVPDLGVLVQSAIAQDPELKARIPPRLQADLKFRPSGRTAAALLKLMQVGHRFRRTALVAILVGGLLLFLGVALPRQRQAALLRGGAALATAALVVFFLPALGRSALKLLVADPELRPVAVGLWDAFMGGLRTWALVLAGVGIVFASAASSFARHVEIEDLARSAWQRLQRPSRSRLGETLRALTLVGIGLVAMLEPAATLSGLAVVAGGLLAFEGLRELFVIVPPRIQEVAREAEEALAEVREEHKGSIRTIAHHGLVGLLVVAAIAGAITFLRSPDALTWPPSLAGTCNGSRTLCDRRIDEVVFPGAHNSMGAAELGWLFPNQELASVSLLRHGIRALQFDVHYGIPVGGRVKTDLEDEAASRAKFEPALGSEGVDAAMRIRDRIEGPATGPRALYLCHGFCELGATRFVSMLEEVREFLVSHPGEVLIFVIEDYVTPADIAAAFRASGVEPFVYQGPLGPPWPTLREMIDSGGRVLVLGENETEGVPWYHPAFEVMQETPFRFLSPQEFSCRQNRGGTAGSLLQFNHWIETLPAPRPSNAAIVNAYDFLLGRARICQEERGKLPQVLAVDFVMTGDTLDVAAELNGLAPDPSRRALRREQARERPKAGRPK